MTTNVAKFILSLAVTLSLFGVATTADAWRRGYYGHGYYYHHRGYWNGGYYYAYPAYYGGARCRTYAGYYDQYGRWHRPYRYCW